MASGSSRKSRAVSAPRTYLGLDLSGARNQKTTLATLEYYPREKKIFLLEIDDRIGPREDSGDTGDQALLDLITECGHEVAALGVNVPLTLPPCLVCARKTCSPETCNVPAVKWMRETVRKAGRKAARDEEFPKPRAITPYTQRPVELWIRYHVLPELDPKLRFDVDEALGGNRAPLTARMSYLKKHLRRYRLVEVLPKLTMAMLVRGYGLPQRLYRTYRHLEQGAHSRSLILEEFIERCGIFIYDRDLIKLSRNLSAFDAFLCAFTALLCDTKRCAKIPKGFPKDTGWVHYPKL